MAPEGRAVIRGGALVAALRACCTRVMAVILHFLNRDALAAALSGPEGLSVAYTIYNDHSTSWDPQTAPRGPPSEPK